MADAGGADAGWQTHGGVCGKLRPRLADTEWRTREALGSFLRTRALSWEGGWKKPGTSSLPISKRKQRVPTQDQTREASLPPETNLSADNSPWAWRGADARRPPRELASTNYNAYEAKMPRADHVRMKYVTPKKNHLIPKTPVRMFSD